MQTLARSAALGRHMTPKVSGRQSANVASTVRGFVARPVAAHPARASARGLAVKNGRRSVQVQALFGTKTAAEGFYGYQVKDIDGKNVSLDKYKGKVVLVVNLASACGFTPQYAELQELYNKYSRQGLVVLGFPCNQFGGQEPGSNSDIKSFAKKTYGVTFPLMAKVDVNGSAADPLFDWLKSKKGGFLNSDIKWNFSKFLVNKDGEVVGRYGSTTTPGQIEADIQKYV